MKTTALVFLLPIVPVPAAPVTIVAPGGDLKVVVDTASDGRIRYSVTDAGVPVLDPSPLGVVADGVDLGSDATLGEAKRHPVDEAFRVYGSHAVAHIRAVDADIPVVSHGRNYTLRIRAQDDGFAVRYMLPADAKHLDREDTGWIPARPQTAAWQDFDASYEGHDHATPWTDVPDGRRIAGLLTVDLPERTLFLSEADNADYPDFAFVRKGGAILPEWYASPKGFTIDTPSRHTTPWRTTTVARDLTALVNSDLIAGLCPTPESGYDFSFVKPGRVLWQWCSVGAPKLADQRDWYDATVKLGWEYYMIDDGWRIWKKPGKDRWALLGECIAYGKTKGVGTFVWVDSKELFKSPEVRDAYLRKIAALGAAGIKIDFIPHASADVMRWYDDTLRATAKLKLMTVFHGCVKPTGRERTWPHALTREGIRGNEYQMTRYKRVQPLEHDATQPFTRFLAGAGDITPLVADPAQLGRYTLPHMFAQAVISLSPLECFYDQYKFYVGSPEEDLLRAMPTVWDETRVLPGTEIGKVVGFARRKGDTWWVAVMNGANAGTFTIALDFLKKPAAATYLRDAPEGSGADRSDGDAAPGEKIALTLRPGGGFLARLTPRPAR